MTLAYLPPAVKVINEGLFFCIETYFIEFLDLRNVDFDTNFIVIALTEAKIWGLM